MQPLYAGLGPDILGALRSKAGDLCPCGKAKAQPHAHAVHRLTGVQIGAGAKGGDSTHLIAQQKIRGAAGDMEQKHLLGEQCLTLCGIQRRSSVTLLMGSVDQRNVPCRRKGGRRADTSQKTGHIAALYRARLLRNTYGVYFCQVEFLRQLLQHLRQSCCVMEQCIALPETKLPGFYRQKALFCTNNLPGCIKNCQRGCIVACIDPERITAHCSADSVTASSLRPWSRATAPSRPFTNW